MTLVCWPLHTGRTVMIQPHPVRRNSRRLLSYSISTAPFLRRTIVRQECIRKARTELSPHSRRAKLTFWMPRCVPSKQYLVRTTQIHAGSQSHSHRQLILTSRCAHLLIEHSVSVTSTRDGQLQRLVKRLFLREKTLLVVFQAMSGRPPLMRNGSLRS